ncbi:MAG: hypothetical protein VKO44_01860 [Cyanobacteriota bacterium]|nr:hypothetical protein [Cyanobacteriota bacterium]
MELGALAEPLVVPAQRMATGATGATAVMAVMALFPGPSLGMAAVAASAAQAAAAQRRPLALVVALAPSVERAASLAWAAMLFAFRAFVPLVAWGATEELVAQRAWRAWLDRLG